MSLQGLGPAIAAIAAIAGSLPADARASDPAERPELRLLAAASLVDVIGAIGGDFAEARLAPSFGASSELARQAADGAPGDVLISASPEWIDYLAERGAVAGEPLVFAGNTLVCATARGSRLARAGIGGADALLRSLRGDDRIALAAAGVPAGDYAHESLEALGVSTALERRIVRLRDVRAVLRAVEANEVVAGFVYATDTRSAGVALLFRVDPATHRPIRYVAAVLRQSRNPELARRLLTHLRSPAARARFESAGFSAP